MSAELVARASFVVEVAVVDYRITLDRNYQEPAIAKTNSCVVKPDGNSFVKTVGF